MPSDHGLVNVETIERYGASYSVPNQALQLVTPVRWDVGVGVQRKPMDTGTAGTCECGAFPCIPKARANPSHLLSDTLPKGKTLFHGGRRGAGELGFFTQAHTSVRRENPQKAGTPRAAACLGRPFPAAHPQHPRRRPRFTPGSGMPPSAPRLPCQSAPEPSGARRCVALVRARHVPQDGVG